VSNPLNVLSHPPTRGSSGARCRSDSASWPRRDSDSVRLRRRSQGLVSSSGSAGLIPAQRWHTPPLTGVLPEPVLQVIQGFQDRPPMVVHKCTAPATCSSAACLDPLPPSPDTSRGRTGPSKSRAGCARMRFSS